MGLLYLLKQARLNPSANGLICLKHKQTARQPKQPSPPPPMIIQEPEKCSLDCEGVEEEGEKEAQSLADPGSDWFGSAPPVPLLVPPENTDPKEERLGLSVVCDALGVDVSGSSSPSESAYLLRLMSPPLGPKLKRRLAKPRPDELIIVDLPEGESQVNDDSDSDYSFDLFDEEPGPPVEPAENMRSQLCEVLRLQAVRSVLC